MENKSLKLFDDCVYQLCYSNKSTNGLKVIEKCLMCNESWVFSLSITSIDTFCEYMVKIVYEMWFWKKKKQKENSVVFDYLHGIFDSQDAPALTCTGKLYENLLLAYFYFVFEGFSILLIWWEGMGLERTFLNETL